MSDIQIINKINPSSENQAVNDIKTGNTELLYARKGSASSSKVVWRRDRIVSITGPSGFDSTWKVTLGTDSENERHENLNTVNNTPFTNATDAQLCESSSTGCNWFLKYGTLANFTITINVPNSVEKYIVGVNININGEMKNLSDYFTISKSQRLTPMVYSDMEIYKEWTLTSKVALTTDMRIDVTFDTYFKFSLSANKSKYDITLNQHAAGDQSQILGSTVLSNETGNKSWYYIYTLSYTATFYSVMYMNNKASSSDDEYLITDFSKTSFANHTTEQITEVEESVICGGIYYASFLRAMMPNNRNQNGIKQVSFGNTCLYTNYTITISTSQVYRTHVKSDLKRGDSDEDLGLHLISTKVGYKKNPTDTSLSTLQEVYRVGFDDFYVYTAQYTEDIEDTGETYYLIVSVLPDNEEDGDGPSSMRLFNSYYNRSITKKINNVSTNVPNVYKIAVQVGKGNEYTLNSSRKRVALSYNYTNESSSTYSSDPEWKHTYTGKAYYGDQIIDGQNAYYSNYFCKQLYVRKWYDKDSSRDTVYFWQGSRTGYDISSTLNKTLPYTLVNDSESLIYAVYQTIQTFVVSINEGTGVYDAYLYNQNNIYGRIDSESSVNYGTNIGGVIVIKGPWYEHKEISGYHYVYYHSYYMRTDREYNGYYWSCSTQEDTEYRTTYKTTSTQKITSNYDFGTVNIDETPNQDRILIETVVMGEDTHYFTSFYIYNNTGYPLNYVNLWISYEIPTSDPENPIVREDETAESTLNFYDSSYERNPRDYNWNSCYWDQTNNKVQTVSYIDAGNNPNLARDIQNVIGGSWSKCSIRISFKMGTNYYCGGDSDNDSKTLSFTKYGGTNSYTTRRALKWKW